MEHQPFPGVEGSQQAAHVWLVLFGWVFDSLPCVSVVGN